MSSDATWPPWRASVSAADDAYTSWFNAQQRCVGALRAWNTAPAADRETAYRAYVAALELEAQAAGDLERFHRGSLAA